MRLMAITLPSYTRGQQGSNKHKIGAALKTPYNSQVSHNVTKLIPSGFKIHKLAMKITRAPLGTFGSLYLVSGDFKIDIIIFLTNNQPGVATSTVQLN